MTQKTYREKRLAHAWRHRNRASFVHWKKRRRGRTSFDRWVKSLVNNRVEDLPEFFTAIFATGPKIVPAIGKRIRLDLAYIVYLRSESYQIPHLLNDLETPSAISGRVDLVKTLPGQSHLPARQRRVHLVISYDAYRLDFKITNTPDLAYDLHAMGTEFTDYLFSDRLQFLYDPNELTLGYQGVALRSIGSPIHGGKTATLYAPPICHFNNNLTYHDSKNRDAQISYSALSGPSLNELKTYSTKLDAKESIFVTYQFIKYFYDMNGQLQPKDDKTRQLLVITLKLNRIDFGTASATSRAKPVRSTAKVGTTNSVDKAPEAEANVADPVDKTIEVDTASSVGAEATAVNTGNCMVSGVIHQVRTIPLSQNDNQWKINPNESDQDLFKVFNLVKIQHWQTKDEIGTDSPTFDAEHLRTAPPYISQLSKYPERANICHIMGKNLAKYGVFPYVPIPREDWTTT